MPPCNEVTREGVALPDFQHLGTAFPIGPASQPAITRSFPTPGMLRAEGSD